MLTLQVQIFTHVYLFHIKDKVWPLNLDLTEIGGETDLKIIIDVGKA